MSVKTILLIGNELLRKKSERVDFEKDPVKKYIQDLRDTLLLFQKEKRIGRAIAAPQVGYQKRIVYMEKDDKRIVMINPQITQKSQEIFEVWDSCFALTWPFLEKHSDTKELL